MTAKSIRWAGEIDGFLKGKATKALAYNCIHFTYLCVYLHSNFIVCVYDNGKGLSTVKFNKQDKISIFPCHFFSRYRSRYLKDDNLSAKDVILHFHTNNTNAYGEVVDDDFNFALTCNDGVMLGTISEDGSIVVNKTFVGFDMLFDSQDEYKNEFYDLLKKYEASNFRTAS